MLISDLDTPAVIVDLDVMERNLSRVAGYCREHQLLLRPHTKTHKIPELAKRRIGDRLSIIPNHVCTTVNMHDEIYGVRGERVEEVWRVEGRGKVR